MSGKREREREKISKFEKFVVGPFAVGNEINTSSFDKKKKKVSKKSKRRKRRNVVFSNDSFIPSLSTSRVFFCFATPLLYISYLPSSSSNPSSPLVLYHSFDLRSSVSHTWTSFSHQRHSITSDLAYNDTFSPRSYSHANSRESFPPLSSPLFPSSNFIELN